MSEAFKVRRAELIEGAPGADVATILPGQLFYPRADGETFDWPGGRDSDRGIDWRPAGMSDGELISLRAQLVWALTAVEDAMSERNMFRRFTP